MNSLISRYKMKEMSGVGVDKCESASVASQEEEVSSENKLETEMSSAKTNEVICVKKDKRCGNAVNSDCDLHNINQSDANLRDEELSDSDHDSITELKDTSAEMKESSDNSDETKNIDINKINKNCTSIDKEISNTNQTDKKELSNEINTENAPINSKNDQSKEKKDNLQVRRIVRKGKKRPTRKDFMCFKNKANRDIAKLLQKKRNKRKRKCSDSQDDDQSNTKRKRIPNRPGISFEIGARLEAKDYLDKWYPSKIVAVDEEEAEVLIHFERWSARFDEWMPMDSPRIRAITHPSTRNEQKEKTAKLLPQYKIGEEVLARWTDCKMYPARVLQLSSEGFYDVLFYDGFRRSMQPLNIEKLPKDMIGKVEIPTIPNEEKIEKKKSFISPKESGKTPKKIGKSPVKNKNEEKDLKWILGKRKRLIVGGIFQAKRSKFEEEKLSPPKQKYKKRLTVSEEEVNRSNCTTENSDIDASVSSPVGYIDGRKIARKEFIIEEDHNHFKCKIDGCNKSFRKDKLLQSHMKHYHNGSFSKQKEKIAPPVQDKKENTIIESSNNNNANQKIEEEEEKTGNLKIKSKVLAKQETSKTLTKNKDTQLSPKLTKQETIKSNSNPEISKNKTSKSLRIEAKLSKQSSPIEASSLDDDKTVKVDSKIFKTEKTCKIDNKIIRENKSAKIEKVIKTENKNIIEEKTDKNEMPQEIKNVEDQIEIKIDQDDKLEVSNIVLPDEKPAVTIPEKIHSSRSKKRRTISASESNDTVSNIVLPEISNDLKVINEILESKPEEKLFDNEKQIVDIEAKVIPDNKPVIHEEEIEDGQSDEIVHCACNCIEENGLMMQCEICLTWQHGACFEIDDVKEVPDKYVCYVCLNPKGLRESFRYKHDQDWFKKGELTTFNFLGDKINQETKETSLITHDFVSSLHNILSVINNLQCKLKIAKEENHSDLIMWKKPWMDSFHHSHNINSTHNDKQVITTRAVADFDHSYFSLKHDLLGTNTSSKASEENWYHEDDGKKIEQKNKQSGETSQFIDQHNRDWGKTVLNEKNNSRHGFIKKEEKSVIEIDPLLCKKNLLDHINFVQNNIEQQLNTIEEQLQIFENETGNCTSINDDADKEIGNMLGLIRKLMKDLTLAQQLTQFQ